MRRVLGLAGALCAAACVHGTPAGPSGDLTRDRIVDALRHQGVTASSQGTEPRDAFPFFAVPAKRLVINGDDGHVFEFGTELLAVSAASTVGAAGTPIGTTQVTWIFPPHFYRRQRFIVLYLGSSAQVLRALEAVFDKPFAGGGRMAL